MQGGYAHVPLATPVAYVTSVFEDVFAPTAGAEESNCYLLPYNAGPPIHPYPFAFANRRKPDRTIADPGYQAGETTGSVWAPQRGETLAPDRLRSDQRHREQ